MATAGMSDRYRLTENVTIGVLAQFDWAKDDRGALLSEASGNGRMIGPYLSARIHDNIYLDLRAAWGRSDNDISAAGASGSFDTARWLVKGTLAGNWVYGRTRPWRITLSRDRLPHRKRRRLHQLRWNLRSRSGCFARPSAIRARDWLRFAHDEDRGLQTCGSLSCADGKVIRGIHLSALNNTAYYTASLTP